MENLYARREKAREIREREARNAFNRERVEQQANDDEVQFPNFLANFYKTLPQNDRGFVDAKAYRLLLRAINSGDPAIFEEVPQDSNISDQEQRPLANPQAALAFVLEGPDPSAVALPPAPEFESQETAAEMVELYWMALLRDIPFTEYDSNSDVAAAVEELNTLEGFQAPKRNGQVTPKTLFRGNVSGATIGPLVPQFYLRESPFNSILISPKQRTFRNGMDYMTAFDDFLEIQRGLKPHNKDKFDDTERLIRNTRDFAAYVQADRLAQSYLFATQQLLDKGGSNILDQGNPYRFSNNQSGFATFNLEHINTLLGEVIRRSLQAAWYQKWAVHRRLRPEVFGARIDDAARQILSKAGIYYWSNCPIPEQERSNALSQLCQSIRNNGSLNGLPIAEQLLNSKALERTFLQNGTFLLPQAYPEGSPTHPSYPAGHATAAGSCGTLLKAFFNESVPFQDLDYEEVNGSKIVEATPDGTDLQAYTQDDADEITVGSEINKLAFHHATARSYAGVHYRSDNFQGLMLGEEVAIQLLQQQKSLFNEAFSFTLTKFDGTKIVI